MLQAEKYSLRIARRVCTSHCTVHDESLVHISLHHVLAPTDSFGLMTFLSKPFVSSHPPMNFLRFSSFFVWHGDADFAERNGYKGRSLSVLSIAFLIIIINISSFLSRQPSLLSSSQKSPVKPPSISQYEVNHLSSCPRPLCRRRFRSCYPE